MNHRLYQMAMAALDAAGASSLEKQGFEAMPGGQPMPQAMDPSAAGGMPMAPGGMPMDPSMAGGAMPVDPSQLNAVAGVGPDASSPPPAALQMPPAAASPLSQDQLVQAVRQVLQEVGMGGNSDDGKSKPAKDMELRLSAVEAALAEVLEHLGMANPQQAVAEAVQESAGPQQAAGLSSGSGQPSDGETSMPIAGPMDPAAAQAMSDIKIPVVHSNGQKIGSIPERGHRVFDQPTERMVVEAVLRAQRALR